MSLLSVLVPLAQVDAITAFVFAVIIAGIALWRRRRPLTFNRIVEVGLPASLLVVMGIRYTLLGPYQLLFSSEVLGPGAGGGVGIALAGIYLATGVVGFISWRESVNWKLVGAAMLTAVALGEAVLVLFVLDPPAVVEADTIFGVAVAALTLVFGVFNWAHRSATPSPLGGAKGPPLDY